MLTRHRGLDGRGKRGIADEEAEFDIPILGAEGEVGALVALEWLRIVLRHSTD